MAHSVCSRPETRRASWRWPGPRDAYADAPTVVRRGRDGFVRETQLLNLKDNPLEFIDEHHDDGVIERTGARPAKNQKNLAGDAKYAAKLAEMEALLLSEMRRLDDPYRLWDQPED